jgi:hypothetical protein
MGYTAQPTTRFRDRAIRKNHAIFRRAAKKKLWFV